MDVNKIKITAIAKILILILLMLTGYFILVIFPRPDKPKSEQVFIPPANEKPAFKSTDKITPSENPLSDEKSNMPILPFFEDINKAAKTVETKLKNEIATPTQIIPNITFNTGVSKSTSIEITLSLTNDEFRFLYPDSFITSLIDGQNLFIKSYDPAYEPLLKIETDSQVRFVEEKIVAALLSINMLTKEEAERYINTIRFTLPQLQLVELKNRKSSTLNQSFITQFSIIPFSQPPFKGLFLAGLVEKLYSAFIPKAQAECGYCYILPECYQIGAPSPTPGLNVWKAYCYCTGCFYGQGCKDFFTGQSAIWDITTGICGGG